MHGSETSRAVALVIIVTWKFESSTGWLREVYRRSGGVSTLIKERLNFVSRGTVGEAKLSSDSRVHLEATRP